MPDFQITSPDGRKFRVTAPPGATKQEALDRLRAKLGAESIGQSNAPPAQDYGSMSVGQLATSAIKNVPSSAVQFGKDIAQPIMHPIETATNIKNLGKGVLQKLGIMSGADAEPYADAVGKFLVERYGSGEAIKKTLATDPVGMAADISTIFGAGELALPGRIGKVAGVASKATNPLSVVGAGLKGAGQAASVPLGIMTGSSGTGEDLRIAARAGAEGGARNKAFVDSMRGVADPDQIVNDARSAVANLRNQRGQIYNQQMASTRANSQILGFSDIDAAVGNTIKQFSGRSGTGPTQVLSKSVEGVQGTIRDYVEDWKKLDPAEFHTPEGLDALKQKVGDLYNTVPKDNAPARAAIDKVYGAIKDTIVKASPEYGKAMEGYDQARKQIQEIERELTGNKRAPVGPALRKILSSLRNNVNTNYGNRREFIDLLERNGAPHLAERVAGMSLSHIAPRGLARAAGAVEAGGAIWELAQGNPRAAAASAAALAAGSPRLMGEAAHGLGVASRLGRRVPKPALGARLLGQPILSSQ